MAWVPGPSPKSLASGQIRDVVELFLHETGEVYAEASVVSLPIPEWNGNLVYVDTEQAEPRTIHGVLWATPFKDGIVRVAAFVLRKDHQNHGHGGQAWHMFQRAAVDEGYTHVQLEVKANNTEPFQVFQALLPRNNTSSTVTMVQQGGYVLLQQINIGTLLIAADRTCNLGAVRRTLSEVRKDLE